MSNAHRRRGVLVVNARTNRCTPQGYLSGAYTADEIDAVATYEPGLRCCHLIPASDLAGRTTIYLRLKATQNNQADRVNWARDYELESALARLATEIQTPREPTAAKAVESICLGL